MWESIEPRLRDVARRAGVADVSSPVLAAACVLCALACVWALWRWWPREPSPLDDLAPGLNYAEAEQIAAPGAAVAMPASPEASAPPVWVHVCGAVRHPGVYEVRAGGRVADAVEAAGGMLPEAVASSVNLARPVADGEQILVPDEDDPPVPVSAAPAGSASAAAASAAAAGAKVNVNTADAAALDTLPGVGPSTAGKILAEREANGPFASVDDLTRVSGIGPKKLELLRELVCVR